MSSIKQVYHGSISLLSRQATVTVLLPASINVSSTFLMFSIRADGDSNNIGSTLVSGEITNATTLTFKRFSTVKNLRISWQVYEFYEFVNVYRGMITLTSSGTTNVAIPSVNIQKSFVIFSSNVNAASNDYGLDETIRARLTSSTNLELTIASSGNNEIYWQVIEYQHCTVQQINATLNANSLMQDVSILNESVVTCSRQFSYELIDSTTIRFMRNQTGQTQYWTLFVVTFDENEVRIYFRDQLQVHQVIYIFNLLNLLCLINNCIYAD